jgi:hypothetical protein
MCAGQEQHEDLEGLGQEHYGGFADDEGGERDGSAASSTSRRRRFRRSHVVAPPIAPHIFLCMCRSWIDYEFDGTSRQRLVNQVLGNLCHLHYPGMVTLPSGQRVIATTWEHFCLLMMETMELLKEQCHGEDVNWRKKPIDSMVLYTSGGGKSHGR